MMGHLLSLLRGVESSLRSRLGSWMEQISVTSDQATLDITQLQIDVTSPGGAYLTQATWFVNSATGNDANDGETEGTAIKTLNELGRRFYARSLPQSTSIQLRGTFSTERLVLDCHVLPDCTLTVTGDTPTVNYSGTISTYTALVQGVSAGQMTDAGRNFVADAQRRCRITSGARADVHWWILKDLTGNTARISQPILSTGTTLAVPVGGDPYNIETLTTTIGGCSIFIRGGGQIFLRDIEWVQATASVLNEAYCEGVNRITFFGNRFAPTAGTFNMRGTPILQACSTAGSQNFIFAGPSIFLVRAFAGFFRVSMLQAGNEVILQANAVWQGVSSTPVTIDQNTYCYAFSGCVAFFDCTSTTAILTVSTRSGFEILTGNVLWGISNTAPYGVKVTTSGTMLYGAANPPTLTGNVGGQDTLIGNSAQTWVAIQAATGYMNAVNGAMIAQRL